METSNYLLFDFGASHGRCIIGRFNGISVEMQTVHEFDNRPVNYAGSLYWDILRLCSEIKIGMQKAFAVCPDIRSVGIDTWGCDFGFIDKQGRLQANPMNYRDDWQQRYKPLLDETIGEYEIFRLAGANTLTIMGLYRMYAFAQEHALELEYADRLLMIPDLMNYYLTGIAANEYTNATMTLMVDQQQKTWQKQLIDALNFPPHVFGQLTMPGTVLGPLSTRISEEYEIPQIPVVLVASHDTASAIAGVPLKDTGNQWAFLSLGTWAILGIESDTVYTDRGTFETGFATQGGCEGRNNFVNLFTGLWIIQQCYERWCRDAGRSIGWDTVVEAVKSARGGIAFINPDATVFAPPSPNMPGVVAQYCADTGQAVPQGMGEIARCVYESFIVQLCDCYKDLKRLTGNQFDLLHIFGGGIQNKLLCQWIADALNISVKAGPVETTSVGNLLMQMIGTGEISDLKQGREISATSFSLTDYAPKSDGKWEQYHKLYASRAKRVL
jgi:sugar (pentulose or hexulose) kinase